MLADPAFQHAIQRIPQPGAEREVMADYYPSGEYLPTKEAFEARGCPADLTLLQTSERPAQKYRRAARVRPGRPESATG
jgi:hypothetical protein